jgi:hypothetical protein
MLPRQVKALMEMVRTELLLIRDALREQIRAIRDTSEAANQTRKEIPQRLLELRVSADEKTEAQSYRHRAHTQQVILTWGTWLAFGAAAIYAAIAARQLRTMNRTYFEMQKQTAASQCAAKAAQQQADLARRELVGTFSAAQPAEPPGPTPFPQTVELLRWQGLHVHFLNAGKVPATDFSAEATMTKYSLPSFEPIGSPRTNRIGPLRVRPYEQMPQGISGIPVDDPSISLDVDKFSDRDIALLRQTKETSR